MFEEEEFGSQWKAQRLPNRQVTIERVEKFIGTTYWRDVNLRGKLYSEFSPISSLSVRSIPDGARPSFADATGDASLFLPTRVGASFGPSWSTHWFRAEFEVPEAWVGGEVHLLWDSSCEAMVWSAEGAPLQGLTGGSCDEARKELVLGRPYAPGAAQRHVFFVEVACNGMFGCGFNGDIFPPKPDKQFALAQAELALFNRDAWDLIHDLDVLVGLAKHLPGGAEQHPRAAQALFVANQMVNLCHPSDPSSWPRARRLASAFLAQGNGAGQATVSCVGNTHIDTAWLWPYAETRRKCARSFASQLRLMREFPFYKFACPQAQQLAWVREDYPQLFAEIQQAAAGGQFCPTGGCWVEMDCNIPSGESIVRQFFYGQRFFEQHFGRRCTVFWLPDTFGYNSQLPQLMRAAGMEYFLTQKLSWNLFNKLPSNSFVWQGLDGSQVLVHFPPADSYVCRVNADEVVRSATSNRDKDRSPNSYMLFGFGDGGGGPTAEMLERLSRMRDVDGLPRLEPRSPEEFFGKLQREIQHPLKWVGELYFELHRGTFTTHAAVKLNNRRTEVVLRDLEYLYTLARLQGGGGVAYPFEELERLWKLMLLQQFHDVLPGTSIHLVYEDVARHYADIQQSTQALLTRVLQSFASTSTSTSTSSTSTSSTSTSSTSTTPTHTLVCNTLGYSRTEWLDLGAGPRLISLAPYEITTLPPDTPSVVPPSLDPVQILSATADGITVRNGFFTACFAADGRLRSLLVRAEDDEEQADWDAIDPSTPHLLGNQFVLFDDVPLFWDAWCAEMYHVEKPVPLAHSPPSFEVVESSAPRVVVRFRTALSALSTVRQDVAISAHSPLVEFDTHVEWHENRKILKVFFPLSVHADHARFHIPFGWVARPTHRNTSWDMAKFEVVGHYWADLSQHQRGVALLNDCKYGYAVLGNLMSLSLLRASKYPDESADMGAHRFRYALLPRNSDQLAPVVRHAQLLNCPPRTAPSGPAVLPALQRPAFLLTHTAAGQRPSPSVLLDVVKQSEVDLRSTVLRFYESLGGHARVYVQCARAVSHAATVTLLEDHVSDLPILNDGHLIGPISLTPFQVITLSLKIE